MISSGAVLEFTSVNFTSSILANGSLSSSRIACRSLKRTYNRPLSPCKANQKSSKSEPQKMKPRSVLEPLGSRQLEDAAASASFDEDIERLMDENRLQAACTQFMALTQQGVRPPPSLCDRLVQSLSAQKRSVDVGKIYAAVKPLRLSLSYNTYQQLINAHVQIGKLDAAVEIFRELQSEGRTPNKVTYCLLISGLFKVRKRGLRTTQLAYELWQELRACNTEDLDATALRTGMKACVDVGRVEEAADLLATLKSNNRYIPDARSYNILLGGYARYGKVCEMASLFNQMKADGVQPSFVTYNTLVDGYAKGGALLQAKECILDATKNGVKLDAWSYTSLMKGYIESNSLDAALEVWSHMQRQGVVPTCTTYSVLVDGYVRRGNFEMALKIIDAMVAAGEQPSTVTYNAVLRGYAAAGGPTAIQRALELLEDMQRKGIAPASDTFNTLMSASIAAENPGMALELYKRMRAAELQPDGLTYTMLIQAHSRLGELREAVSAFETLSRDSSAALDLPAYNAMVDAFARQGEMEAAEKMLDTTCKFAQRMGKPVPVRAYGAVVSGYVRLKSVQPALDTVKRFHAAGGTPDVQMLDMLVDVCVRTGEYRLAMQAVRAMELLGNEVDKVKYKDMLTAQISMQGEPGVIKGRNAKERRQARIEKNENLERFKFWLGLPNNYYDESS